MSQVAGQGRSFRLAVNLSALALVALWTIPTAGLLVTSFRDKDQISVSGWWTALSASEENIIVRTAPPSSAIFIDGERLLIGRAFEEGAATVSAFGVNSRRPTEFAPGETAVRGGALIRVDADGSYRVSGLDPGLDRGTRLFITKRSPPRFTLENYDRVVFSEGLGRSFLNTFTVTIPATIIPILVAAFAAYALAWIEFPGRTLLLAAVVGLLVVPLQLALIPLLQLHNSVGIGKAYLGIWLAHTGFGLPLAIYLLRNFMSTLPRDIIESARLDGCTEFHVFRSIVLPLSYPALASFAIFQFLWVWNDLLVATVFLGNTEEQLVMTGRLRELLGSRGGDWEILAASAFVSIAVPLLVFFALQRHLVRGLLAGAVK